MTFGFQGCGVAPGAFHFAEMLVLSGVLTLVHKSMPCSLPLGKKITVLLESTQKTPSLILLAVVGIQAAAYWVKYRLLLFYNLSKFHAV
jgi:hypothetical protein